ncbi:MAG: AAA family ATPase, partial [Acidimicrobiales bacterium]
GRTTALAAVREAFEADGYVVIGTSTSGQAARTLGRQAGIEPSRTLASLVWRLDHGQLTLTDRHVVVLDEASMSDDAALLRVATAAAAARSKLVMVGDHHQLGAVGPGGGFEALVRRYGAAVHVLADNVRQHDVAERAALARLRDGNVATAVAWYAATGRIVAAPDRADAVEAVVAGWKADVEAGHQAMMYAWRRANVAALNRAGRQAWRSLGRLGDDELVASGGAPYAVGDRVVTLAPGAGGKTVTSETGTVAALRPDSLIVRMDDDGALRELDADEIATGRLAHAYAITIHRSQGSTVQRAHALEDGGGRELAYVKMSRARERSMVYVVADSVAQATEDLCRDWSAERRLAWAIDTGTPARQGARGLPDSLRRAGLVAERAAIAAAVPPDCTAEIRAAELRQARLQRDREDLEAGMGRHAEDPIGRAVRELQRVDTNIARLERNIAGSRRRERSGWRRELPDWQRRHSTALRTVQAMVPPERARLDAEDQELTGRLDSLRTDQQHRQTWLDRHPEAARRLERLTAEIDAIDARLNPPAVTRDLPRWLKLARQPSIEHGRDFGIDLGR